MSLPKACSKPCNDCPWRRVSAPGWLGPMPAADWLRLTSSDEPVACHTTIDADENGEGDWSNPRMRQCKGAAIYRRNTGKLVRNPEDASNDAEQDKERVFASPMEFLAHHGGDVTDLYPAPVKLPRPTPVVVDHFDHDDRDIPCEACPDDEAEWQCSACRRNYCDGCLDAFDGKCPECMVDAGWMPLDDDEFL